MAKRYKRPKPEVWLAWGEEDWGRAEIPINEPARVAMGAASRLMTKVAAQWRETPDDKLWGRVIAVECLQRQWDVQKRIENQNVWRESYKFLGMPKPDWPKGEDARNHTYWKWMQWRATLRARLEELAVQDAMRKQTEEAQAAAEAADTHPWARRDDIRSAWRGLRYRWRDASVWRSIVFACHRDARPGITAWPVWMRPQVGGKKKGKSRDLPTVLEPNDPNHPQGRNRRLRQVFEGLPTRADQIVAVAAMATLMGSAPDWMIPREVDQSRRTGRPKKNSG
jgi:hypothetical protein